MEDEDIGNQEMSVFMFDYLPEFNPPVTVGRQPPFDKCLALVSPLNSS